MSLSLCDTYIHSKFEAIVSEFQGFNLGTRYTVSRRQRGGTLWSTVWHSHVLYHSVFFFLNRFECVELRAAGAGVTHWWLWSSITPVYNIKSFIDHLWTHTGTQASLSNTHRRGVAEFSIARCNDILEIKIRKTPRRSFVCWLVSDHETM